MNERREGGTGMVTKVNGPRTTAGKAIWSSAAKSSNPSRQAGAKIRKWMMAVDAR